MINKYLLSSVLRRPEGEGEGADQNSGDANEAFKEALAFDPGQFFTPPAKEGQDEGEGGDSGKDAGDKDSAAAGAASQGTESAPPSSGKDPADKEGSKEDDPIAALRESVKSYLSAKQPEPAAKDQPNPAETAPKAEPSPKEEVKGYDFTVPMETVDALGAEEPATRQKAINAIVNGMANRLAQDFGRAMAEMAKQVRETAVQEALGQVNQKTSEEQVRADFYSAYPDIKELADNLPALDGVVWQTAAQIAKNTGQQGWTPQLRDQLGATLRLQLKLSQAQGAPEVKLNGGKPPRKPSFSAGSGSNGARPGGAGDASKDMLDVLGAGH